MKAQYLLLIILLFSQVAYKVTAQECPFTASVSGPQSICANAEPASIFVKLQPTEENVSYEWQYKTEESFQTAPGVNNRYFYSPDVLEKTTTYRAVIKGANNCTLNSEEIVITVNPYPKGGSISGATTICSGNNSATLTINLEDPADRVEEWWIASDPEFSVGKSTVTTQEKSLVVNNLTNTTYYQVWITNGFCSRPSDNAVITVKNNKWTGSVSNNWFDEKNWDCGLPSPTTSVEIPAIGPIFPVISGNKAAEAYDISIAKDASLIIEDESKLEVFGSWINKGGTFTANKSTVTFSGDKDQQLQNEGAIESFYILGVNKTGGNLTINSFTDLAITPNGTLDIQKGFLNANGRRIILQSMARKGTGKDSTARLAKIGTGAYLINDSKFTVQRFIPLHEPYKLRDDSPIMANHRYTFLAPSVHGLKASDWADSITIVGGGFGGNLRLSTLLYYSELSAGAIGNQFGWRYVMEPSTDLPLGTGYKVFTGLDNDADLVEVQGNPQIGKFNKTITYTEAGTKGWNLIGNPYPCEIDFDKLHEANSSIILPSLAILEPYNTDQTKPNSSYYYYNVTSGIELDPRPGAGPGGRENPSLIASSQAFFVQATIAAKNGADLVFTEEMKSSFPYPTVTGNFRKENQGIIRINLSDGTSVDRALVYLNENGSDDFDPLLDAIKLPTEGLSISTGIASRLAINGISSTEERLFLPLHLSAGKSGKYFIKVVENQKNDILYLYDKVENTFNQLTLNKESDLILDTAIIRDRYFLTNYNGLLTALDHTNSEIAFALYPNPFVKGSLTLKSSLQGYVKIELLNLQGEILNQEVKNSTSEILDLTSLVADIKEGSYFIRCTNGSLSLREKLLIVK